MDVSRDGTLAATGEVGPKPIIALWSVSDQKVIWQKTTPLQKGIGAIGISAGNQKVAAISVNQGDQFPYAIFDIKGNLLFTDKSGADFILDLVWSDDNTFATVGPKHYYVWTLEGKPDKKKQKDGKDNKYSTVAAFKNKFYAGAGDAFVQCSDGNGKQIPNAKGPIESIY